jgi:hypothetical protein
MEDFLYLKSYHCISLPFCRSGDNLNDLAHELAVREKIPAVNRLVTGVGRAPAHLSAILSAVCRAIGLRS